MWQPAVARVREEVADMQQMAHAEGAGSPIAPWDYRFDAEKVRKAKYDLDEAELKPHLQLEQLREAMFWAATQNYGFSFTPAVGVPVGHPDVRVWEVKNAEGRHVAFFYFDPYARAGKRSGAWMNAYRAQERFEREALAQLGMPPEIVMRHRLPQFAHIFAGEGYSAGYYSYLWADTLTADAAGAFLEAGGL